MAAAPLVGDGAAACRRGPEAADANYG